MPRVFSLYDGVVRGSDFHTTVEASSSQDARYKIAKDYRRMHRGMRMYDILALVISQKIRLRG